MGGITKTRLFKYMENFTTKNLKFSNENSDIFYISGQNIDSPRRFWRVPTMYIWKQK